MSKTRNSYFKVIVDKDKFTLYDTSKDKYYPVEPDDIEHILDVDQPYNDDGTLNLLSYSDVVGYFNRKYAKHKPTKGYTSKRANIKKEYTDVAKLNRTQELKTKLKPLNLSEDVSKLIEKYPITDVVQALNVDAGVKQAILNVIQEVDKTTPLDTTDKNQIQQDFVRDKSSTIQDRQRELDRNNMQTMQRHVDAINTNIQNLPNYTNALNIMARDVQNLEDNIGHMYQTMLALPTAADYQQIRGYISDIRNNIRQLPSNANYREHINAITDKLDTLEHSIQNNRPLDQIDYHQQFDDIQQSLNNLSNNVAQIRAPPVMNIDENNALPIIQQPDELQMNRNDNIARMNNEIKEEVKNEKWTEDINPVDVTRKNEYKNVDITPIHTLMRLLNAFNSVQEGDHQIHVMKPKNNKGNIEFELYPFNDTLMFHFDINERVPFANIISDVLKKKDNWNAEELLREVVTNINEKASDDDFKGDRPDHRNRGKVTFKLTNGIDIDPSENNLSRELVEFATKLPSSRNSIKLNDMKDFYDSFEGILDDLVGNKEEIIIETNRDFDSPTKFIYDNITTKAFNLNDIFGPYKSNEAVKNDVEVVVKKILDILARDHQYDNIDKRTFEKACKEYIETAHQYDLPNTNEKYEGNDEAIMRDLGVINEKRKGIDLQQLSDAIKIIGKLKDNFNSNTWNDVMFNYLRNKNKDKKGIKEPTLYPKSTKSIHGIDENYKYIDDDNAYATFAYAYNDKILDDDSFEYSDDYSEGGKLANILGRRINKTFYRGVPKNSIVSILSRTIANKL